MKVGLRRLVRWQRDKWSSSRMCSLFATHKAYICQLRAEMFVMSWVLAYIWVHDAFPLNSILWFQVNLKPRVPTKAVCAEHLELRREILTWLNLQKQVYRFKKVEESYLPNIFINSYYKQMLVISLLEFS
jgi:hypothetical protein